MPFYFTQKIYKRPGIYQWTRPPTGVGAGPFGTTYLLTIVTVIAGGSGGGSGFSSNITQVAFTDGGSGGNAGGYAQGSFPAAVLPALEDIIVGKGTLGGVAAVAAGVGITSAPSVDSLIANPSSFGHSGSTQTYIECAPGQPSTIGIGGTASVGNNSTNTIANRGGTQIPIDALGGNPQFSTGPGITTGGLQSWNPTGNNAGAGGGTVNLNNVVCGGDGGGVNFIGGGSGNSSAQPAHAGSYPGAGGGSSGTQTSGNAVGGAGANAFPNTGAGGGGGGAATSRSTAGGGVIISGNGGNGSDGLVQVTDVFILPLLGNPYYWDFNRSTFFHMMNMARPISLTGRYQS